MAGSPVNYKSSIGLFVTPRAKKVLKLSEDTVTGRDGWTTGANSTQNYTRKAKLNWENVGNAALKGAVDGFKRSDPAQLPAIVRNLRTIAANPEARKQFIGKLKNLGPKDLANLTVAVGKGMVQEGQNAKTDAENVLNAAKDPVTAVYVLTERLGEHGTNYAAGAGAAYLGKKVLDIAGGMAKKIRFATRYAGLPKGMREGIRSTKLKAGYNCNKASEMLQERFGGKVLYNNADTHAYLRIQAGKNTKIIDATAMQFVQKTNWSGAKNPRGSIVSSKQLTEESQALGRCQKWRVHAIRTFEVHEYGRFRTEIVEIGKMRKRPHE